MTSQRLLTVNPPSVTCPTCEARHPTTRNFCGHCGSRLPRPAPAFAALGSSRSPGRGALSASRATRCQCRRATVLFCDVVGFTAISERLDPEEVFALMDRAFGIILDAVHRHEGTVNQFLGDGAMALFEAADGSDDHAERALAAAAAVHEALELLRAEVRRTHGIEFRARTSLHTGSIVVGAIGGDLRADYTALGRTAHVATCLLRVAAPGQIVVTDETRRLAADSRWFQAVGEVAVDGDGGRVAVHALLRDDPLAEHHDGVEVAGILCA